MNDRWKSERDWVSFVFETSVLMTQYLKWGKNQSLNKPNKATDALEQQQQRNKHHNIIHRN